ncbi:kinesin motor domain-containing protein, partial [Protomyces lactucae-debilis]
MEQSSISVNIRVRPFTVRETSQMQPQQEERQVFAEGALTGNTPTPTAKGLRKIIQVLDERVLVFDPADSNPMARFSKSLMPGKKIKDVRYAFDHIFDETATQREVFEHTSRPLLNGIFDGFNATVFAYGATGCGKTHTISGTREDPGLIFQTFEELFARIEALKDDKLVDVSITYLEIYNETIRDLLIPGGSNKVLSLREDANKQISVAGLSTHVPESVEHVMELILMGNANRTISPTEANAVSSRSHAVLQVNVSQKARTASIQEDHVMATLSIIDLAGSERASVTKNRGDRLLEGANINRSLLALGNCINALCDPHRKCHIPYRDSKLTRLLKFSLGGNCRTVMVVCVSPSSAHYDETHNTLKYGNRAKNIKTK